MPILYPDGSHGAPVGWQWAQDAYAELLKWGRRAGEPTYKWELRYPDRWERIKGTQWRLTYSTEKELIDVYIGWDGRSVAKNIRAYVTPKLKELAAKRNSLLATERVIHDEAISSGEREDPIFNWHFARTLLDNWLAGTKNIRTREQLDRFKREHPRLMENLGKRAGILDMSMLQYLTKHKHAKYWPHPPKTREEYEKRQAEFLKKTTKA